MYGTHIKHVNINTSRRLPGLYITLSRYPNTIVDCIFGFVRFLLAHDHSCEWSMHSRPITTQDIHTMVRSLVSRTGTGRHRLRGAASKNFALSEQGVSLMFPNQCFTTETTRTCWAGYPILVSSVLFCALFFNFKVCGENKLLIY